MPLRSLRGPSADWIEPLRSTTYPLLHPLLERVGGFALATVGDEQYVGWLPMSVEALEHVLWVNGFKRNPLAALKRREDGAPSAGSWAWRPSLFAHRQLHVVLIADDGGTSIYAHLEPNIYRHPRRHLSTEYVDFVGGANTVRQWLTVAGYEPQRSRPE